jgi:hypothetical protein
MNNQTYARDSRIFHRAGRALAINWLRWYEQNGELEYLCADHNSVEDVEKYSGDHVLER